MPTGYHRFNPEILDYIQGRYPRDTAILDVGAGSGKWVDLLRSEYPAMDALEVWQPYVDDFRLRERYRHVFCSDARATSIGFFATYKLVILGDVLEHMSESEAQSVLEHAQDAGCEVLVALPYRLPQEAVHGNPYEAHVQDELTKSSIARLYPWLLSFLTSEDYGIYIGQQGEDAEGGSIGDLAKVPLTIDKERFAATHIAVATPCGEPHVATAYVGALFSLQRAAHKHGFELSLLLKSGSSVEVARNMMVAEFLAHPEYTHLLFIDSDQGWQPRDVLRLLAMDRPLIAVAARKKMLSREWAVDLDGEAGSVIVDGALRVDGVGCGFMLIRRDCLEAMVGKYVDLRIKVADHVAKENPALAEHYYRLFQFGFDDKGTYRSEDLNFCRLWREMGGEVFVDPDGDIVHVGTYEYRGALSSVMRALPAEEK